MLKIIIVYRTSAARCTGSSLIRLMPANVYCDIFVNQFVDRCECKTLKMYAYSDWHRFERSCRIPMVQSEIHSFVKLTMLKWSRHLVQVCPQSAQCFCVRIMVVVWA